MRPLVMRSLSVCAALLLVLSTHVTVAAERPARVAAPGKPVALECDSLESPRGDDAKEPLLSWKLQDGRIGARQTAYRILVASAPNLLTDGRPDVWDSGRVESDRSVDVPYGGRQLSPETRYYWRVQAWDMDGAAYPLSDVNWWETGLLDQANWKAQWIGYEDAEQKSVRQAQAAWITNPRIPGDAGKGQTRHDFRLTFDVPGPVKRAVLYVTGEDTAAAWIDGRQVMEAQAQPA